LSCFHVPAKSIALLKSNSEAGYPFDFKGDKNTFFVLVIMAFVIASSISTAQIRPIMWKRNVGQIERRLVIIKHRDGQNPSPLMVW
jgi:hypothetical protein